jgi:cell division transport system ATP-binding protein
MIRFENVSLSYPDEPLPVLRNVSLDLAAGSFHFVTGASGAGKTSLLKLMYLSQLPTSGHLSFHGKDVAKVGRAERTRLRRRIGVVFQDFRLLPHLTALENVALPLQLAGAHGLEIRDHVAELLRWVGLGDRLNTYPAHMSGGEQQRTAIARAVVGKPGILLADEPTGNVDDEAGVRLLHLFSELHRMGTTVVIATHSQTLLNRFGHPQLHLEKGMLVR